MNTYADAIRRQAEDAPRAALPAVAKAMWSAFAAGQITEAEAEALSALIEARQTKHETVSHLPGEAHTGRDTPQDRQNRPRTGVGSRCAPAPALSAVAVGRPAVGFLRP